MLVNLMFLGGLSVMGIGGWGLVEGGLEGVRSWKLIYLCGGGLVILLEVRDGGGVLFLVVLWLW